jgi:hypothetical protein
MPEHLTENELRRMREFAETPVYKRKPEQLMPQADEHHESSSNRRGNR